MQNHVIRKVADNRWKAAQAVERAFALRGANRGDDHNKWWLRQFDSYAVLRNRVFPNVLEVGCGPHTNARLILPLIVFHRLFLEDPLMEVYVGMKKTYTIARPFALPGPVEVARLQKKHNASLLSEPLEELSVPDESMDLCICINVLDHVRDADKCISEMRRVTRRGGTIVLGQDLSDKEDAKRCPESWEDPGHPIKVDDQYLEHQLRGVHPLLKRLLAREQGRNPRCHYGTYLLIGELG